MTTPSEFYDETDECLLPLGAVGLPANESDSMSSTSSPEYTFTSYALLPRRTALQGGHHRMVGIGRMKDSEPIAQVTGHGKRFMA